MEKEKRNTKAKDNKYVRAALWIPNSVSPKIKEEIIEELNHMRFNKISIPLNIAKKDIIPDTDKLVTVGYIKFYNADKKYFQVVIFNNFKEVINNITNPIIEIVSTEYQESLNCITKFIIKSLNG